MNRKFNFMKISWRCNAEILTSCQLVGLVVAQIILVVFMIILIYLEGHPVLTGLDWKTSNISTVDLRILLVC